MEPDPDLVEARIERLAANGTGLARVGGQVVFVRGALPKDWVRARIVRRAKRHAEAVVVDILEPSPDRRASRCAHFGACGGCTLQDLDYAAQLEAKRGILLDALRSIGGLRPECEIEVVASPEYGWRSRVEFQVASTPAGPRPAVFRAGTRELVPIRECPVLVPALESELGARAEGRIPVPAEARALRLAAGDAGVAVVALDSEGHALEAEPEIVQRIAGLELAFGAAGFFQGNRALVEALVDRAAGSARGELAFDLYAGSGLFSLQLARTFDLVLAVEEDAAAVERLRANAVRNGRTGILAEAADVGRWLARARKLEPDLVLLDPPRSGAASGVAEAVAALEPREIRYVSCDPATLARDLKVMLAHGQRLTSLHLVDLFPQTLHVETVARLVRGLSSEDGG